MLLILPRQTEASDVIATSGQIAGRAFAPPVYYPKMEATKVNAAVEACLASTSELAHPFRDIADFIALLKDSPHWSDREIQEVQSRVIRGLLDRQGLTE